MVGTIEPHQFVGFSGGVKSAAIGLGGYPTVTRNHSRMVEPLARIGRYEDNPCRQDIEEIGRLIGVHFALNVVLTPQKAVVRAIAGEPVDVMRRGIPHVRRLNQVTVERPYDLMIVSPGGHPKDVNVYQAQKALAHAALVTRPGGTIIVAAACPDGAGSPAYEGWMRDPAMVSHEAVLERFAREGYRIGPHKAFMISRDSSTCRVLFHSQMPDGAVAHAPADAGPRPAAGGGRRRGRPAARLAGRHHARGERHHSRARATRIRGASSQRVGRVRTGSSIPTPESRLSFRGLPLNLV